MHGFKKWKKKSRIRTVMLLPKSRFASVSIQNIFLWENFKRKSIILVNFQNLFFNSSKFLPKIDRNFVLATLIMLFYLSKLHLRQGLSAFNSTLDFSNEKFKKQSRINDDNLHLGIQWKLLDAGRFVKQSYLHLQERTMCSKRISFLFMDFSIWRGGRNKTYSFY
jgi:hypothetical protein